MNKPNIILVLADDMGYGDFSSFNQGRTHTPALDQLAQEGLCLSQHYSASPVCAPARASLLTGRYPHRTGVIDTYEIFGLDRLSLDETTIADIFQANGYATGLVGKWHCGAIDPRYHPNQRGFKEFAGFRGGWQDYYQWRLDYNGRFRQTDGAYLTDIFAEEAVQFLQRHQHEPFFLHVAFNAPHFPLQVPEAEINPFLETGKYTRGVSILYGMLHRMDLAIERILNELNTLGLAENTIFLFTSDNGPDFGGSGEMCLERFNCGLNGAKALAYEGGIRLPLIMRWPEKIAPGTTSEEFVHFTDWLPTLTRACHLNLPSHLKPDGENVLPQLLGEKNETNQRECFWQWNRFQPFVTCNAAMRDGEWKLVRPEIREYGPAGDPPIAGDLDSRLKYEPEKFDRIQPENTPQRSQPAPLPAELYNLKADPQEQHNLAADHPDRVNRMLVALENWFEAVETERRQHADFLYFSHQNCL